MTDFTDRLNEAARSAITGHFAPWTNKHGVDMTHHEPIDHIEMRLSERALRRFLHLEDRPKEVDGVPLRLVERPVVGMWDMSLMCRYHSERHDKIVGSRGALCRFPSQEFA
jgi:hypothetical protein